MGWINNNSSFEIWYARADKRWRLAPRTSSPALWDADGLLIHFGGRPVRYDTDRGGSGTYREGALKVCSAGTLTVEDDGSSGGLRATINALGCACPSEPCGYKTRAWCNQQGGGWADNAPIGDPEELAADPSAAAAPMRRDREQRPREAARLLGIGNAYPRGCSELVCQVVAITYRQANTMTDGATERFDPQHTPLGAVVGIHRSATNGHVAIFVSRTKPYFIDVREEGATPRSLSSYGTEDSKLRVVAEDRLK